MTPYSVTAEEEPLTLDEIHSLVLSHEDQLEQANSIENSSPSTNVATTTILVNLTTIPNLAMTHMTTNLVARKLPQGHLWSGYGRECGGGGNHDDIPSFPNQCSF